MNTQTSQITCAVSSLNQCHMFINKNVEVLHFFFIRRAVEVTFIVANYV